MGHAMIQALVSSNTVLPAQIFACNRTPGKLKKIADQFSIQARANTEEVVEASDIVIIAVKPQDLTAAIEPHGSIFGAEHVVISLAAGYSLARLRKLLPQVGGLIRLMPNTPASIRRAVVGYCCDAGSEIYQKLVESLMQPLGLVTAIEEGEMFEALTVSAGSGTGFVFELMQYWQEWLEEHGFSGEMARKIVVQTFLGASELAHAMDRLSLSELQAQVVSKKGVTAAGLDSMRELEVERALRYSFEKAVLRDQEISKGNDKS